ncbi:hypothetical protein AMTR_s00003p00264870 [Amborella trichopoda]|uniref:Uncharacterized protein n=1 Tax=Amborella trichopoda TaxID=13333 RepID=W1P0S6_AMBTC|nr:hypothetical protein AMTR_s00003p00264870 [Amborella trichopoda]
MWTLSQSFVVIYPPCSLRRTCGATSSIRSSYQPAVASHYPFAPEVVEAVDHLYPEFRKVDNLVAINSERVLRAYQNARVGSHGFWRVPRLLY